MAHGAGGSRRLVLGFGAASLVAVGAGAAACALSGVPTGLWGRNLAAWAVGAGLAWAIAARAGPRALSAGLWAAVLGLALTFLSAGQQGVHRWIALGPLSFNAAMLLLPAAAVGLAAAGTGRWRWAAAFAVLGLAVLQPDASQASAWAAVVALAAAAAPSIPRPARAGVAAAAAGLAALAWTRPDPLAPVPEVEGVLALAYGVSPLLAALALAGAAAAALAPALAVRRGTPAQRLAGAALTVLFLAWLAAPFLGAFPVPLAGVGLSPILGAWLGVGALAATGRQEASAA